METLRYPIGRFDRAAALAALPADGRLPLVESLAAAPAALRQAVAGLSEAQLDTPYRPEGWTVRQLVHHVPDSHLNAYVRMRWALTEDQPLIKTYDEKRWAELADARSAPIEVSLALLETLHERWVLLLRSLSDPAWDRALEHPEWGAMSLTTLLQMYEWHGRHHVAHIRALRDRMKWS